MTASADFITEHIPSFCRCCGNDLSGITAELSETGKDTSIHFDNEFELDDCLEKGINLRLWEFYLFIHLLFSQILPLSYFLKAKSNKNLCRNNAPSAQSRRLHQGIDRFGVGFWYGLDLL